MRNKKRSTAPKRTSKKPGSSNNRRSSLRQATDPPQQLGQDALPTDEPVAQPKDIKTTLWAITYARGEAVSNAELRWLHDNKEQVPLEEWQVAALLLVMKDRRLRSQNESDAIDEGNDLMTFCRRLRRALPQKIRIETDPYWEVVEKDYVQATAGLGDGRQLSFIKMSFIIRITFAFAHCLRLSVGDKLIALIVKLIKDWLRRP
ncbi:MAG TPA: hypothetical protein VHC44_11215 [Verrucomicrobiae bacterium]|nr:hypothetical protein [Verrucomicrobiae bacterium]